MSNIFQEVLTDVKGVEERMLGPTYPYYKNIKTPTEIGMSTKGSLSATAKDVDGLINYVELLVSGGGKASSTGRPLGNKFFLKTGAKCTDKETNQEVDRYIYVNNVPTGNIPFISSGMGVNFKEFKGLIPGTMSDLNVINPFAIMQSFLSGSNPECQQVTMETIDINNNRSSETNYMTTIDIQNMDPCIFPNKKNPVTNQKCRETFQNYSDERYEENEISELPEDFLSQFYFASLAGLGIYLLYKISNKHK
jgi:hypothetical protein